MITISDKDFSKVTEQKKEHFISRATSTLVHLKEKLHRSDDHTELKAFVKESITEALLYEIDREEDLIRYISLKYKLKPSWNETHSTWIFAILKRKGQSEGKLNTIIEQLRFSNLSENTL
ncbi:hypothetical protein [Acanthopleuribacter pedis]|uniref:Uncharacterized protein n=1 Tax=Acanthopleuribacter pedis TaxID=442870 RepID=A0A8J7QT72_9BACT|nr:hypothetical protein [Acanthopleuribacter pedis]MBO1323198.1 hypothetical protein [Acanthopleuribacter pedis]